MGYLMIPLIGISLVALIFLHGGPNLLNDILENRRICKTKECRQIANDSLNSMNESVNPCDDFHEFACGNWHNHNPGYESYEGEIEKSNKLNKHRLLEEFGRESSPEDILPVQKMKKAYKLCMNRTQSDVLTLFNKIFDEVKGWSMIMEPGKWNSSAITWQKIIQYYEETKNTNVFYDLTIIDSRSESAVLQISRQQVELHLEVVQIIARQLMNFNKVMLNTEKLEKESLEVMNFTSELQKISEPSSDLFFENIDEFMKWWNNNTIESSNLQNNTDWKMLISILSNIKNLSNTENTPIRLMDVNYFKKLPKLLELTDKHMIDNYIHSMFITLNSGIFVDDDGYLDYIYAIGHIKCEVINEPMARYLFNRKYYGSNVQKAAEEIVENVKETFKLQIKRSDWFTDEAKKAALEKVNKREFIIGEEWYMNETALTDYYEDLTISENYVENYFQLRKCQWKAEFKKWGKPMKYKTWPFTAIEMNLKNFDEFNYALTSEATFQSFLFADNLPDYLGYGRMAWLIASQMGPTPNYNDEYSFFKSGKNDTKFKSMLNESAQCFIDKFDKYVNNSGSITLSENLATWYGFEAGFDTYNVINEKKHPNGELKLPGLRKYNDQQMFFLSFAQFFCGNVYEWSESMKLSPFKYMVIGTLSNTQAFADAFKCPKNSPMNPEKKCNILNQKSQTP